MKKQPNRNYISNDIVMTPNDLASKLFNEIVGIDLENHRFLDPSKGNGAFFNLFPSNKDFCEISEGKDFFEYKEHVDWIITNPPWSLMKKFLEHSLELANEGIAFLCTINHLWTTARINLIKKYDFGISQIILIDRPSTWPQSGFQHGMFVLRKSYNNDIKITSLLTK